MRKFWKWYGRHHTLNLGIAAGLFSLQLVHLFWLTTNVVFDRAFGFTTFSPSGIYETVIILVDYTEIPALLSVSLVYIHKLKKKFSYKPVLFLIFLNSQWLHIFWITDEFVLERFGGDAMSSFPIWAAWIAIMIDYLELPVIYDTTREFIAAMRTGKTKKAFESLKECE